MRWAIVSAGEVVNVVLWDGSDTWAPSPGQVAVNIDSEPEIDIGWTYDGSSFAPPGD